MWAARLFSLGEQARIAEPVSRTGARSCHHGLYSSEVQNSRKRSTRFSGGLPAMRPALMAPLEVPITQSGSIPASWSAS